jgi:glycosyltransferase involved in cell wall biosynthesis
VDFRAALVGDGPLSKEVRREVVARALDDSVTVLPFSDVWPILAAFDIYALPSLWESLPIGLLEAMAMGLPVVASDTGGVREAVLHGETGLLHPVGDVEALADGLERLLRDPELRLRMGDAGRRRQTVEYSLEAMLAGTSRAYAVALGD